MEVIANYPSTGALVNRHGPLLGYYNAAKSQVVIAGGLAEKGGIFHHVVRVPSSRRQRSMTRRTRQTS